MTNKRERWYVAQRGELLAKEFLVELGAKFVASLEPVDVGVDYMAFFERGDGSTVIFGVEVKATDRDEVVKKYVMPIRTIKRLQGFNIPSLIVLAHVKYNEIHFLWAHEIDLEKMSTLKSDVQVRDWRSAKDYSSQLKQEIADMQRKIA
jgi:hypothetical protein